MQKKISHSLYIISQAIEEYPKIAVAVSFGKDSMVILHLCRKINPNIQVFTIVTPFLFEETNIYRIEMINKWKLNYKEYGDDRRPLMTHPNHNQPEECCTKFKVEPTKEAIRDLDLDAWISGLRNTEGHTREFLDEIEEKNGLIKINPILKWTEAEVFLYHSAYKIPLHPLYMQGYRSLGCRPCSNPYTETERGGRWQGTDKCGGECGIHTQNLKSASRDHYGVLKRDKGKF